MTDLIAFLNARLDEDERETFELVPYPCEPGCCAPAGWVGHHCRICGTTDYGGTRQMITQIAIEHDEQIHERSRRLREVAAKRAILAEHEHVHPPEQELERRGRWGLTADRIGCSLCHSDDEESVQWYPGYCTTVRALAFVYSLHADCDPEWSQQ